jgi:queuosine precursor transporter
MTRISLYGVLAMAIVVVASNILVQHPIGTWLTWGAFTYPLAFLVSDIVNRLEGPAAARRVVYVGFVVGLACSAIGTQIMGEFGPLVTLRVALGSAIAFLLAQLLDIMIFDSLRRQAWWKAPFISTFAGSTLDTAIFFTIAFSASLSFIEPGNDVSWAAESVPLLGVGSPVPFWVSLGVADWCVKIAVDLIALLPFRFAIRRLGARVA